MQVFSEDSSCHVGRTYPWHLLLTLTLIVVNAHLHVQVRVVRHMIFVMAVLCTGTVIVGMIEALAAYLVRPWWLQVAVNLLITIGAFVGGTRVFDFSHEWLIGDSSLDYPLWALDICVIS